MKEPAVTIINNGIMANAIKVKKITSIYLYLLAYSLINRFFRISIKPYAPKKH